MFPRLVGGAAPAAGFVVDRTVTGIAVLDAMVDGGFWRGSASVMVGASGVGKTKLGLKYLLTGAQSEEPEVLVTFQESPSYFEWLVAGYGAHLDALQKNGQLRVIYSSPLELDLVELLSQIQAIIAAGKVRRLVVNAMGDLKEAAIESGRYRALVWSLVEYLRRSRVTGLLLLETGGADSAAGLTQAALSYMADNIVHLRYCRPPCGDYDRVIEVVKTRASRHDPFPITAAGLEIAVEPLKEA